MDLIKFLVPLTGISAQSEHLSEKKDWDNGVAILIPLPQNLSGNVKL